MSDLSPREASEDDELPRFPCLKQITEKVKLDLKRQGWDKANANLYPGDPSFRIYRILFGGDGDKKGSEGIPFINTFDLVKSVLSGQRIMKVVSFCYGILVNLDYDLSKCQALVLAPTRDIVLDIVDIMENVAGLGFPVKVHAFIGGKPYNLRKDERVLSRGVHVVVGTPGRVTTILKKGLLDPGHIDMVVLDEADEMLSWPGSKQQFYDILHYLPRGVPLALFSEIFFPEALIIMKGFMANPMSIFRKSNESVTMEESVKKLYVNVKVETQKFGIFCHICKTLDMAHCVIFANTPRRVEWLATEMRDWELTVSATHREMDQNERDVIEQEFRSGCSRFLITTDLRVRAIDLQQVSVVINYDLPNENDGRDRNWCGGRFRKEGVFIDLVTGKDKEFYDDTESFCNVVIVEDPQKYFPVNQIRMMPENYDR